MTVYELIQRLAEAPADMEVVVNVDADGMDYEFEDNNGRERCIGLYINKDVEVLDAYEKTYRDGKKMVIDLYSMT